MLRFSDNFCFSGASSSKPCFPFVFASKPGHIHCSCWNFPNIHANVLNQLVSAVMNVYDGGTRCSSTFNTTASSIQRTLQTLSFMSKEHFVKRIYKCNIIQLSWLVCCSSLHHFLPFWKSQFHHQIWFWTPQEYFMKRQEDHSVYLYLYLCILCRRRSFNFLDGFSCGVEAEKPAVAIPVSPTISISGHWCNCGIWAPFSVINKITSVIIVNL